MSQSETLKVKGAVHKCCILDDEDISHKVWLKNSKTTTRA